MQKQLAGMVHAEQDLERHLGLAHEQIEQQMAAMRDEVRRSVPSSFCSSDRTFVPR